LNTGPEFLGLLSEVKPERDDKLKALIKLLKTDRVLKKQKLILFTEFADTARYLERELNQATLTGIHRIDGGSSQKQRSDVIRRFSPYYNESSSAELAAEHGEDAVPVAVGGLLVQPSGRVPVPVVVVVVPVARIAAAPGVLVFAIQVARLADLLGGAFEVGLVVRLGRVEVAVPGFSLEVRADLPENLVHFGFAEVAVVRNKGE
jgi:hypothetical protein